MKITIKFTLRKTQKADANSPVYLQITVDRKNTQRAIGYELPLNEWNPAKEEAKKNIAVNAKIQEIKTAFNNLQYELQKNPVQMSPAQVADQLLNKRQHSDDLLHFFLDRMEMEKKRKVIAHGTYKHYKSCHTRLGEFITIIYKKKDVPIDFVDLKFIESFDAFLLDKNLSRNSINNNYHKKLKTTLNAAILENRIDKNPYNHFKLTQIPTLRGFLTEQELNQIQNADFSSNRSLEKVRDLFVFSCYTGLRFSDAQNLTTKDLQLSEKGNYIYRTQNKTSEVVHIPLAPTAIEIIRKYDNNERMITGNLLPKRSNQKLNSYLKNVAELSGIDKKLTHHNARHTFATFLLNNGVQLEIVQKMLGHKNIRTTQIYAKITTTTISNQILSAFAKINNTN